MMYFRYSAYLIVWIAAMISGILGMYFVARYTGFGASVWGNPVDGWCGDKAYQDGIYGRGWWNKLWPCWWWSCVRNPANGLLRGMLAAEGTIHIINRKSKNMTVITMVDGRKFFFWYNEGDRYLLKFGWRFWKGQIKDGEFYSASFVFNP